MASDIRPNLGLESNWANAATGWDAGANKNFNLLDALLFPSPITGVGTPPGSPALGAFYLIPDTGTTGAWVGHENDLAIYAVSSWIYVEAKEGWRVRVGASDPAEYLYFDGTDWVADVGSGVADLADLGDVDLTGLANGKFLQWNSTAGKWQPVSMLLTDAPNDGLPYVRKSNAWVLKPSYFRHFKAGVPTNNEVCAVFVPEEKTQFPIDLVGSYATVETVGVTASTVFKVQKNTSDVGTLTFAAGATKGVFAMASASSLDPTLTTPDRFRIVGPATANAALAGLSVTLKGTPVA